MIRSGKKERWIIYTLAMLLCMVLASFWLLCNIYARYSTTASGSDSARVAKFSVTDKMTDPDSNSGQEVQEIKIAAYPGFTKTYQVSVTNNSEVAIEYVMNVKNKYKNLPLQFQMLDSNKKVISSGSTETSMDYDLSESAEISAEDYTEHTYWLEISWPTKTISEGENLQDPSYAGKTDVIEITLKAVQKD